MGGGEERSSRDCFEEIAEKKKKNKTKTPGEGAALTRKEKGGGDLVSSKQTNEGERRGVPLSQEGESAFEGETSQRSG